VNARPHSFVARRPVLAGLLGALGASAAVWALLEGRPLMRRYAPTPYDDLLGQLGERESAIRLGAAVLAGGRGFQARRAAEQLRAGHSGFSLARAAAADVVQGRLETVDGWLLPRTVELLAGIAAQTAQSTPEGT